MKIDQASPDFDVESARAIKKLYFVLLRIVQEDAFMDEGEIEFHARRLNMVYLGSVELYERNGFSDQDLVGDFDNLFDKLTNASIQEEMYEKTANLQKVRERFTVLSKRRQYTPVTGN